MKLHMAGVLAIAGQFLLLLLALGARAGRAADDQASIGSQTAMAMSPLRRFL